MQLQHSLHRPPSCIGGWLSSMCLLPGISPKPIAQFVTAFDACCPASCPCHLRRDIIWFSFSRELRNATATATDCSRLPDHALSIPSCHGHCQNTFPLAGSCYCSDCDVSPLGMVGVAWAAFCGTWNAVLDVCILSSRGSLLGATFSTINSNNTRSI